MDAAGSPVDPVADSAQAPGCAAGWPLAAGPPGDNPYKRLADPCKACAGPLSFSPFLN